MLQPENPLDPQNRNGCRHRKKENSMNLLDIIAAQEAKQKSIAQVERNMDPDWAAMAEAAIMAVVARSHEFTTDDVWEELGETSEPHERRAMGAAMLRVARQGLIAATDKTRPSARSVCHANPKRVWKVLDNTPTIA
jgi:hypothetical protein